MSWSSASVRRFQADRVLDELEQEHVRASCALCSWRQEGRADVVMAAQRAHRAAHGRRPARKNRNHVGLEERWLARQRDDDGHEEAA